MRHRAMIAALLPAALLLSACPKEQEKLTIRFESGRPVFDGDRRDCIIRLRVIAADAPPEENLPWNLESPFPIANDRTCPLRLPIAYGSVAERIRSIPERASALKSGRTYRVLAEGTDADHEGEFIAP